MRQLLFWVAHRGMDVLEEEEEERKGKEFSKVEWRGKGREEKKKRIEGEERE